MKIPKVEHKVTSYALKGGEDLVTSAIEVDPGRLSYSQNYECNVKGRYRAINGYEVFDGQPSPSDKSYWILDYSEVENPETMEVGDTITGEDSGAQAIILAINTEDQYLVLKKLIPDAYLYYLDFDNSKGSFKKGQTLIGATSGATATIAWVYQYNGSGRIYFESVSGTFQDDEIIYESALGSELLADGDCSSNSFTKQTGWTYDAGNQEYDCDGSQTGNSYIYQHGIGSNGNFYKIVATYKNVSAGKARMGLQNIVEFDPAEDTTYTIYQLRTSLVVVYIGGDLDFIGSVDDISTKQITNAALADGDLQTTIFQDGENLLVGGNAACAADGTMSENSASTTALDNTYSQLAIEDARDLIAAVSGSGNILGVWQYNGVKYAFRNNSDGDQCIMHRSSPSGWQECDLGRSLSFTSGGTYEIQEEDTITGETGAATTTVKRVVLDDGAWADGDAAGTLIIYDQTGTFESETIRVGANLNVATIAANSTENTLEPGGSFEFVNHNFYGASNLRRMYGVDGVSKGFEWDGDTFVPIVTGMTADTPNHLAVFRKHLFYSFPGGSLQHSGTGDPYSWTPVTGASELGIGDDITRLSVLEGAILAVFSRNSTNLLYGSSTEDWDLRPHSEESGCIEWSGQQVGTEIYMDDRGLTTIESTEEYGDFADNVISDDIQPYLTTKIGDVQSAIRVKDKSQYRLFFDDMEGICLTINKKKIMGFTRFLYDKLPVCCCSSENSEGQEELFFGSTDGFVYQMDKGNSFNGNAITHLLRLHYNHLKTPFNYKEIIQLVLDLIAPIGTSLQYFVDFSYGEGEESEAIAFDVATAAFDTVETGGVFGISEWNDFVWDGPSVGIAREYPDGMGVNFALMITSERTYVDPHTLNALSVHYILRGLRY